jgi:hypothetical protein
MHFSASIAMFLPNLNRGVVAHQSTTMQKDINFSVVRDRNDNGNIVCLLRTKRRPGQDSIHGQHAFYNTDGSFSALTAIMSRMVLELANASIEHELGRLLLGVDSLLRAIVSVNSPRLGQSLVSLAELQAMIIRGLAGI